jgi:GNAT superfamily N-acetyltransferase
MTEAGTVVEMTKSGTVALFSPGQHGHLIPYLAAIHASCITHDRTIAEFLPPLSHEKLLAWWKERIAEVADGKRLIFILLNETEPGVRPKGSDVVGVVMLSMPSSETGPFRGVVEKLLVHKAFRGRGGARTLMSALETEATKRGRTILLLDTETGSPAEEVYKKLGYVELGQIPRYGLSPNGELKDGTFFWKHLAL